MCECDLYTTTTINDFHFCQRRRRHPKLFEFTFICCCCYCYFRLVYMYENFSLSPYQSFSLLRNASAANCIIIE